MTPDNDIKRLRHLLGLYYDGQTTPEDEANILRLLQGPAGEQEEFRADRKLFAALADYAETRSAAEADAPAELGKRLERLTRRRFASMALERIPQWIRWCSYTAAAACAAALIWIGSATGDDNTILSEQVEEHTHTDTVFTVHRAEDTGTILLTEATEPAETDENKAVNTASAQAGPAPVVYASAGRPVKKPSPSDADTGKKPVVKYVTEGEEAARTSQEALRLLHEALALGSSATKEAGAKIQYKVNDVFSKIGTATDRISKEKETDQPQS